MFGLNLLLKTFVFTSVTSSSVCDQKTSENICQLRKKHGLSFSYIKKWCSFVQFWTEGECWLKELCNFQIYGDDIIFVYFSPLLDYGKNICSTHNISLRTQEGILREITTIHCYLSHISPNNWSNKKIYHLILKHMYLKLAVFDNNWKSIDPGCWYKMKNKNYHIQ